MRLRGGGVRGWRFRLVAMISDTERLKAWVGGEKRSHEEIALATVNRIQSFYGVTARLAEGDPLPELWHWFFFNPSVSHSELGVDGHPAVGDFLPPIDLPRRMWGGSRLTFLRPIVVGYDAEKISRVISVDFKEGGSGTLGIVRLGHEIIQGGETCLREEQDIIYREAASGQQGPVRGPACPEDAAVREVVTPDPVMLFRYSALTYNAHRIHYDRDYAMNVEGYQGLVVHGPLTASLLAKFARGFVQKPLKSFSFRGLSPLFDGAPFSLEAKWSEDKLDVWARQPLGGLAMQASATFFD